MMHLFYVDTCFNCKLAMVCLPVIYFVFSVTLVHIRYSMERQLNVLTVISFSHRYRSKSLEFFCSYKIYTPIYFIQTV